MVTHGNKKWSKIVQLLYLDLHCTFRVERKSFIMKLYHLVLVSFAQTRTMNDCSWICSYFKEKWTERSFFERNIVQRAYSDVYPLFLNSLECLYFRCKLTFVSIEFAFKTIIYVATGNNVHRCALDAYPASIDCKSGLLVLFIFIIQFICKRHPSRTFWITLLMLE